MTDDQTNCTSIFLNCELRNRAIQNGGRQEATDHGSRGPEAQEGLGRDERHQPRPVQEGDGGAKTYGCSFLGILGQPSKASGFIFSNIISSIILAYSFFEFY